MLRFFFKPILISLIALIVLRFLIFSKNLYNIEFVSLNYSETIIENNKKINIEGTVYYRNKDNLLITLIEKPFKSLVKINQSGDIVVYDFEKNFIYTDNNIFTNSQQSYLWYFLTNNYSDMGLSKYGYSIKETKIDGEYLVQYWIPKAKSSIKHVLLVFNKNQLPVYQEFISKENKIVGKIYFLNYKFDSNVTIPTKIIDVSFKTSKDSSLSIKKYSNLKLNEKVDKTYFNFKMPLNAQVIQK